MTDAARMLAGGAASNWLGRSLSTLVAILFLAVGILWTLYPFTSGGEMPGDLLDSRFTLSMLEYFYHGACAIAHGQPWDFLSAPFFFPWPRVTNFSETFWGDAGFYAVFRAIGFAPLTAFREWFILGFALTYASAFISLRKLGLGIWGAAAGAFLFTFPLPMAAHAGHVQLVYRLWMPPALLTFHRFLAGQSLRAGASCVLFVALQLAASVYLGAFLGLLLASYAVALYVVRFDHVSLPRWSAIRVAGVKEVITAGCLGVAGLGVLAIVGIPYVDVQSMYGFGRQWQDVVGMLPRPGSYLLAGASKIWPHLSGTFVYPSEGDHQIFPGLSAIIPLAWFTLSRRARARRPLAVPMLIATAILVILTIDFDGRVAYPLIYLLPGFSSIRSVTRIILVIMLPLAILLGLLIDNLTAVSAHRRQRSVVAVVLTLFMFVECSAVTYYTSSPRDWRASLQALETKLPKTLPKGAVLAVAAPVPQPGNKQQLIMQALKQTDAELGAVLLGIRTMNGYSGNYPPTWTPLATCRDVGADLRAGRHFLLEHRLPAPSVAADQLVLIGFEACDPTEFIRDPVLQLGRSYRFSQGEEGNEFVGDGFSYPAGAGRRTNAKNSFLFFTLTTAPPRVATLRLEADSLSPVADHDQEVTVVANGHKCGSFVVTGSRSRAEITCLPGAFRIGNNMLQLRVTQLTRPIGLDIDTEQQRLGIDLKEFALSFKA